MRAERIVWGPGRAGSPAASTSVSVSPTVLGLAGALFVAGVLTGRRDRELAGAREEVRHLRREAETAGERAQMLEQVGDTVRDLLSSTRTREEVCRAAIELAGAHAALIYEPGTTGALVCTAMVGIEFGDHEVMLDPTSRAQRAFDVARPVFLAGAREDRVASAELWRAAGRPASVLYQPMVRCGRTLGVLSAGWRAAVPFDGPQCAAVALLAHEAAAVIAHADAVDSLTGESRTDALTGSPNRRAFDASLAAALDRPEPLACVTLDVDAFAHYNQRFGHPAGDRLLKSAVAAWRAGLRPGDTLARVGGGEFAVLLGGCGADAAVRVAKRLRARVPDAETCSAGVAVRREAEPAESLRRRADEALRAAKAGRRGVALSDGAG